MEEVEEDDDLATRSLTPHSPQIDTTRLSLEIPITIKSSSTIAHESNGLTTTPTSSAAAQQQSKKFEQHYRKQQEEIASRLHKAVSDNFKLINQSTENNGFTTNGDRCSNSVNNMNLSLSGNSSRLTVRNFNGKTNAADNNLKLCRLNNTHNHNNNNNINHNNNNNINKTNNLTGNTQHHQSSVVSASELLSSLLDNDDNNNNSSNNVLDDDNNSDNNNSNYLLPCPLCDMPLEPRVFRQHLDRHYPRDSPICPVLQCGRRFAHPNSVRNHMRLKHTLQWAKMKAMRSSGGPFSGIPY